MNINGLSGNELYCLAQKGYQPKSIVLGNDIYSAGFIESLPLGSRIDVGKEFKEATRILAAGRNTAYQKLVEQAATDDNHGIIKLYNDVIHYSGGYEFYASGTVIVANPEMKSNINTKINLNQFTTTANGREFFALLDAGFMPLRVAFGNSVYAMGASSGLFHSLKSIARGEIVEYSEMLNHTRHAALERLINHAKESNADAVLAIETNLYPIGKASEIVFIGTACRLSNNGNVNLMTGSTNIITSNLKYIEMWNLEKLGYVPQSMLIKSVVFSLGVNTNIRSALKSMMRGEINQLTKIIFTCRLKVVHQLEEEAKTIGADMVVGTKFYVNQLGNGLVEIMALATAVKQSTQIKLTSEQLPLQTMSDEKEMLYDYTTANYQYKENTAFFPLMRILLILIILLIIAWFAIKHTV